MISSAVIAFVLVQQMSLFTYCVVCCLWVCVSMYVLADTNSFMWLLLVLLHLLLLMSLYCPYLRCNKHRGTASSHTLFTSVQLCDIPHSPFICTCSFSDAHQLSTRPTISSDQSVSPPRTPSFSSELACATTQMSLRTFLILRQIHEGFAGRIPLFRGFR